MACSFGLYFGSTNMCLAMQKDGKTEVLANAAGDRVTPSVVAFQNGERTVGLAAKQGIYRNANNTVCNAKDLIGTDEDNLEKNTHKDTCKVVVKDGIKFEIEKEGKLVHYSPVEILVTLFSTMKEIACSHSHDEDTYPTVITVPLNFNNEQRESIKKAAVKAGFEVLRTVSEPSAALLAYNIGQDDRESTFNCLVYRMGGTSLDVTVFQVVNGMYTVLSTVRKSDVGGFLLTELLVDFCSSEFKRQWKADIRENKRSIMKLRNAAENCKHVLSILGSAQCFAESVNDGMDLSMNISRARFESIIHNMLHQWIEPIKTVLSKAQLSVSDISKVVLAGGSCKIPKLQQLISDQFPSAEVLSSILPDEVIAVGAAIQATCIAQNAFPDEEEYFIDIVSSDIYFKVTGIGESVISSLLCAKGSLVPYSHQQVLNVEKDNSNLRLEIFEKDNKLTENGDTGLQIAALDIFDLPSGQISFSFQIKSDGSILVICKDSASTELASAVIHSSHDQRCT